MKLYQAEKIFLGNYANPRTRANCHETTRRLVAYFGAERDVASITPADIHIYMQELRDKGTRWADHPTRPTKKGGLAVATMDKHIRVIKRFFKYLTELEVIEKSPAAALKQSGKRGAIDRDKAITEEELALILAVAFGDQLKSALVAFLADTGCRAGGASGLKISDLDLDLLRAIVTEKGDKSRPVFYSKETAKKLRRWLIIRPKYRHDFVFGHEKGRRTSQAISQIIRRLAQKAGIERPIGSHSLRHAAAYQLSDSGISPTVAATVLGHDNAQTTMDYYYPRDYGRAEEAIRTVHDRRNRDKTPIEFPQKQDRKAE